MAEPCRDYADAIAADDFPLAIVNRPARRANDTLRVIAFNARWGRQLDGIIACLRRPPLEGADVILLAEADRNMRRSQSRDVAAEIAEALEMSFAYVPEFAPRSQIADTKSFLGNAILSAYPLADVRAITLPNYRGPRRARRLFGKPRGLVAAITPNARAVTVGIAHLNSRTAPFGRERQMAQFLAEFPTGPAIIGGDFNTTTMQLAGLRDVIKLLLLMGLRLGRFRHPEGYEPLFARLREADFQIDGANATGHPTFTFSGAVPRWARPKLDWIALRGVEAVEGSAAVIAPKIGCFGRRVSDHDFVMCTVRTKQRFG